jgi:mannose-6-phosphate isomerase-like protein (cupin superfamily)
VPHRGSLPASHPTIRPEARHLFKTRTASFADSGGMKINDPIARARTIESFGFEQLGELNGVPLGVVRAPDLDVVSKWERHRDTDELLMVLQGSVTIEILTDSGSQSVPLTAGQFTVVPTGHWHRHRTPRDLIELFYTPGSSEESTAGDPRTDPNPTEINRRGAGTHDRGSA